MVLDALNETFAELTGERTFEEQYKLYYHTGGICNTFLLWFSDGMSKGPEQMSEMTVTSFQKDIGQCCFKSHIHQKANESRILVAGYLYCKAVHEDYSTFRIAEIIVGAVLGHDLGGMKNQVCESKLFLLASSSGSEKALLFFDFSSKYFSFMLLYIEV